MLQALVPSPFCQTIYPGPAQQISRCPVKGEHEKLKGVIEQRIGCSTMRSDVDRLLTALFADRVQKVTVEKPIHVDHNISQKVTVEMCQGFRRRIDLVNKINGKAMRGILYVPAKVAFTLSNTELLFTYEIEQVRGREPNYYVEVDMSLAPHIDMDDKSRHYICQIKRETMGEDRDYRFLVFYNQNPDYIQGHGLAKVIDMTAFLFQINRCPAG